eukprot:TRINITY_DN8126_c0_g1_i4.p1 TRINITY_DN8126_c0_g1~~TRINITY_DN8126_c0_g1_i4.p1  ORF type:complete len:1026 (-),score=303.19 TRINITY_DN8126_c0_g1_i4:160-3237(-)
MFFFFFQAEDGIRDLVRSRGLGTAKVHLQLFQKGQDRMYAEQQKLEREETGQGASCKDALMERRGMRNNPVVSSAIESFWHLLGTLRLDDRWVEQDVYLTYHSKIFQCLEPFAFDPLEANEVSEGDWAHDLEIEQAFWAQHQAGFEGVPPPEGVQCIGYPGFFESLFELIDIRVGLQQGRIEETAYANLALKIQCELITIHKGYNNEIVCSWADPANVYCGTSQWMADGRFVIIPADVPFIPEIQVVKDAEEAVLVAERAEAAEAQQLLMVNLPNLRVAEDTPDPTPRPAEETPTIKPVISLRNNRDRSKAFAGASGHQKAEILGKLETKEKAEMFNTLSVDDRSSMLKTMDVGTKVEMFEVLDGSEKKTMITMMNSVEKAQVFGSLSEDNKAAMAKAMNDGDKARMFGKLTQEDRGQMLSTCNDADKAALFGMISDTDKKTMINDMDARAKMDLMENMSRKEQGAMMRTLGVDEKCEMFGQLSKADRSDMLKAIGAREQCKMYAGLSEAQQSAMLKAMEPEGQSKLFKAMSAEEKAAMLQSLKAEAKASLFTSLSREEQMKMVGALNQEDRAMLFNTLDGKRQAEMMLATRPADLVNLFTALPPEQQTTMIKAMRSDQKATCFVLMPAEHREVMLGTMGNHHKAAMFAHLDGESQSTMMGMMKLEQVSELFQSLGDSDQMEMVGLMDQHDQIDLFGMAEHEQQAALLRGLNMPKKASFFTELQRNLRVQMLEAMPTQEQADLVEILGDEERLCIYELMNEDQGHQDNGQMLSETLELGMQSFMQQPPPATCNLVNKMCAHVGWQARLQFRLHSVDDRELAIRMENPGGEHTFFRATQNELANLFTMMPHNQPGDKTSEMAWLQAGDLRVKTLGVDAWGLRRSRMLKDTSLYANKPARFSKPSRTPNSWSPGPQSMYSPRMPLSRTSRRADVFSTAGVREALDAHREEIALNLHCELEQLKCTPPPTLAFSNTEALPSVRRDVPVKLLSKFNPRTHRLRNNPASQRREHSKYRWRHPPPMEPIRP